MAEAISGQSPGLAANRLSPKPPTEEAGRPRHLSRAFVAEQSRLQEWRNYSNDYPIKAVRALSQPVVIPIVLFRGHIHATGFKEEFEASLLSGEACLGISHGLSIPLPNSWNGLGCLQRHNGVLWNRDNFMVNLSKWSIWSQTVPRLSAFKPVSSWP